MSGSYKHLSEEVHWGISTAHALQRKGDKPYKVPGAYHKKCKF